MTKNAPLILAMIVANASCAATVENVRRQPIPVVTEPSGATVWIEENGERSIVGRAPIEVLVPYRLRHRDFNAANLFAPGSGLASILVGGVMWAVDEDPEFLSGGGALLMFTGLAAFVVSVPFVAVAMYADGDFVDAHPIRGTVIGASLPGFTDDVIAVDGLGMANADAIYLYPQHRPGDPKVVSSPGPVDPKSATPLPVGLRPDLYRPEPR